MFECNFCRITGFNIIYRKFLASFQSRRSHVRCSIKKGILKNFTKFTGKQQCWSLRPNKVAGLSAHDKCTTDPDVKIQVKVRFLELDFIFFVVVVF